MKREEIVVEIDATGQIKADVVCGPGGAGCLAELDRLLSGVGDKSSERRKAEAFHAHVVTRGGQGVKR